ncbi:MULTISPECIES: DUF2238 domain-containing protein [unclassified Fusibacter]|uniref:DUF2238 domain-containing protein n=1 Tax=unclassified Fusibacter TaxID=2624464 RepID=UPI0010136E76|nr:MULTISPECIES: DUF2238 domain-containing protein [unclassified Fusibacter]MCK8060773.1 DUF2238 domain-containing protein [Fusibacter sp. A2]NPE23069.1 DUF2238 domain-containing protein [Fusibacter sp. A1]RXV59741.1 DUF2238 domain-containing protein [Fusibacter sp. A1]
MKMNKDPSQHQYRIHVTLVILSLVVLLWSAVNPYKYLFWFFLTIPPLLLEGSLILTYRHFRFSTLVYIVVFLHVILLLVGAKYTYTNVPAAVYISDLFGASRVHFDRLGHFMQGITPAMMGKELLVRRGYITKTFMSYYIVMSIALAFSAFYELLEFMVTVVTKLSPSIILAPQGDVWDTHWDMIWAIIGAAFALTVLAKTHDKQIESLPKRKHK